MVDELWGLHDYRTIARGALNDVLARVALAPSRRERLIARTCRILRRNQTLVSAWLARQPTIHQPHPEAGGIKMIGYLDARTSDPVAETLSTEHSVLTVPGAHFGLERRLRIFMGCEPALLQQGLARLGRVLESI